MGADEKSTERSAAIRVHPYFEIVGLCTAGLARNVLPAENLENIHLGSVRFYEESLIDEKLRENTTDVLMRFERNQYTYKNSAMSQISFV
jgi:hypothetical protein